MIALGAADGIELILDDQRSFFFPSEKWRIEIK